MSKYVLLTALIFLAAAHAESVSEGIAAAKRLAGTDSKHADRYGMHLVAEFKPNDFALLDYNQDSLGKFGFNWKTGEWGVQRITLPDGSSFLTNSGCFSKSLQKEIQNILEKSTICVWEGAEVKGCQPIEPSSNFHFLSNAPTQFPDLVLGGLAPKGLASGCNPYVDLCDADLAGELKSRLSVVTYKLPEDLTCGSDLPRRPKQSVKPDLPTDPRDKYYKLTVNEQAELTKAKNLAHKHGDDSQFAEFDSQDFPLVAVIELFKSVTPKSFSLNWQTGEWAVEKIRLPNGSWTFTHSGCFSVSAKAHAESILKKSHICVTRGPSSCRAIFHPGYALLIPKKENSWPVFNLGGDAPESLATGCPGNADLCDPHKSADLKDLVQQLSSKPPSDLKCATKVEVR